MMPKGLLQLRILAVVVFVPQLCWAEGRIEGIVLNGVNGAPLPGSELQIEGIETSARTDLDGLFHLTAPAATYVVNVSRDTFKGERVTDVVVKDGEVTQLSVVLMPLGSAEDDEATASFEEEITVTTVAGDATETATLLERKQAPQISDLIGKEELSKNPGGTAAGALTRVPGVSVQDGKYVYIRGLGDRYSNATLNGSRLPSTEFEQKVVPLDLFPQDFLNKISVSKSYRADQPGEFSAGWVDMQTLHFPSRQSFTFSLTGGYNSVSTGENFLTGGEEPSFLGEGGQPIPGTIPNEPLVRESPITGEGFSAAELQQYGYDLIGLWSPRGSFDSTRNDTAPPIYAFDIGYGNTFGKFGLVASATYGTAGSVRDEERTFYNETGEGLTVNEEFDLDYSTQRIQWGGMANFAYAFNGNNRIELRSIYNDLTLNEGRVQDGFFSDLNDFIHDYRISYESQKIYNVQLSGEHYLPHAITSGGSLLEWRYAGSQATTEENRRQTLYLRTPDGRYQLTDNAQSGFMYWNDQDDNLSDGSLDWSTILSGKLLGDIKVGVSSTQNDRDFAGRRLRFFHRNTVGIDLTQPPELLFTDEYIRPNGFELEEITRPTDTYTGDHSVTAAYVQTDLALGKWRVIGGLRYEDSQMDVVTIDRYRPGRVPITTTLDEQELPFSLSLVRQLGTSTNLRGVVSRTVNRPTFRELAPFTYTHIVGGYAVTGNPDLISATIDSYDLRWEWFPGPREVVAASLFYKSFDNPIERVVIPGAEFLETFANAEGADNFGAELEARWNLGGWTEKLDEFTLMANYTYVDSEVTVDPDSEVATNDKRPLAGQPDNIFNFVVEWDHDRSGSMVRLLFNQIGDRVFIAGSFGLPDVIEDQRYTFDLTYIQDLPVPGLSIKLTGRNLTDEPSTWSQGGEPWRVFSTGRWLTLKFSYVL